MKRGRGKSDCPVNYGLEIFGDPWSLLVVRDIVYFGKHTFNEFSASDEAIAPSVLSARLEQLTSYRILQRGKDPADRRRVSYTLTETGLALVPVLLEIAQWSFDHEPDCRVPELWVDLVRTRKPEMVERAVQTVRDGRAVFAGEDNLLDRLSAEAG